jgi:hypothetical protein
MMRALSFRRGSQLGKAGSRLAVAESVEVYFWLLLGTDLGFYDRESAELFARHRFTELLNEWEPFFADWGYLFSPNYEALLRTMLQYDTVGLSKQIYRFNRPESLHSHFQHALTLEYEMLTDDALVISMAALHFLRIPDLEAIFDRRHAQESQFTKIVDLSLFVNEFPKTMLHIRSFTSFDEALLKRPIDDADRGMFRDRIHELTRWRLNLRAKTTETFLPRTADSFFEAHRDIMHLDYNTFIAWFRESVSEWGYTHYLTAPAATA